MSGRTGGIYQHMKAGFEASAGRLNGGGRRIGAELKFPLVEADGSAVRPEAVCALWAYLAGRGWVAQVDEGSGHVIGASRPGEQNDTVASCETGYCKPEFSLAHVGDLHALDESYRALREELRAFQEQEDVRFLGYGIHPVTRPSERLLMKKKSRTSVWDKAFGANRILPPEDGDDVCLFTINAASHVHVSVSEAEAVDAVNVLSGFVGAQIALTADSPVWKEKVDGSYKCVAEKFWDWWIPDAVRVGVPAEAYEDLSDYARTIGAFRPVFVKREGRPVLLERYETFDEYYALERAVGVDLEGREVTVRPEPEDIDVHSTCYWHSARISRYTTVENRANDQQPPEDVVCIAALTLGLVEALEAGKEALAGYAWGQLRAAREVACREALAGEANGVRLRRLARTMLEVARKGLQDRGRGEESYLGPLWQRLETGRCPADEAIEVFRNGGVEALVEARTL